MDTFEQEIIARMRTSKDANAKRFLKWLDKNPTGPLRKRRMAKLKTDAKYILQEDATGEKAFRGRGLDELAAPDWDALFAKLLAFIKLIMSLFA